MAGVIHAEAKTFFMSLAIMSRRRNYRDKIPGGLYLWMLSCRIDSLLAAEAGGMFSVWTASGDLSDIKSPFSAGFPLPFGDRAGIDVFAIVGVKYAVAWPWYWGRTPCAVAEEIVLGTACPLDLPLLSMLCQISLRDLVL